MNQDPGEVERPQPSAAKRWQPADAQDVLAKWEQSGLTLTAFAQAHGLDPARLSRWRSRLARSEEPAVQFHPVKVLSPSGVTASGIEVITPSGHRVAVHAGFDPVLLIQVVEVLDGQRRC
jgi:transposase-like protein